jgi:YggT family protein
VLTSAGVFLIQTVCEFFAGVLLLRFWLQVCRVAGRNPFSQFAQLLTNFIVVPARRVIPGLFGMDLASVVLAWLTLVLELVLTLALRGNLPESAAGLGLLFAMALVLLLRLAIYLAIAAILIAVLISFINPASPMAPVVNALTRPMLRPLQRVIPPVGMFDLSPLVALVILQLLLMLLGHFI